MKNRNEDLTAVIGRAIEIMNAYAADLGLTPCELADIVFRIQTKTQSLVAHIEDHRSRRNPMRLALLGILDWRKSEEKWHTPFRNRRRMAIQRMFVDKWSRIDHRVTAARALDPVAARLATVD